MLEILISGALCKFRIIPEEQAVFPQRQPSIPGSCTVVFETQGRRENAFLSCFLQSRYIIRSQENSELKSFLVELVICQNWEAPQGFGSVKLEARQGWGCPWNRFPRFSPQSQGRTSCPPGSEMGFFPSWNKPKNLEEKKAQRAQIPSEAAAPEEVLRQQS